jgi:hypothetical protein
MYCCMGNLQRESRQRRLMFEGSKLILNHSTPSTSTASRVGSRPVKYVRWITVIGSSRSMVTEVELVSYATEKSYDIGSGTNKCSVDTTGYEHGRRSCLTLRRDNYTWEIGLAQLLACHLRSRRKLESLKSIKTIGRANKSFESTLPVPAKRS